MRTMGSRLLWAEIPLQAATRSAPSTTGCSTKAQLSEDGLGIALVATLGLVVVQVDGMDAPLDVLDQGGALGLIGRGQGTSLSVNRVGG